MSSADFTFRQFVVRHDRCAMKVGTDGVLLGAWAHVPDRGTVLDVGTGCGLLCLMLAQRYAHIRLVGIDIDADAVVQARDNAAASPFASRITVSHTSLQDYALQGRHDGQPCAMVCNPPFFTEKLLPPDARRSVARHADTLPFDELLDAAETLLPPLGTLSVVLPTNAYNDFRRMAVVRHLMLTRECFVQTTPSKAPKRVLAAFAHCPTMAERASLPATEATHLCLTENGSRSDAYRNLTQEFYL